MAGSDSAVFTAGSEFGAFPPSRVPDVCSNSKAFLDTALLICTVDDVDEETKLLCRALHAPSSKFSQIS